MLHYDHCSKKKKKWYNELCNINKSNFFLFQYVNLDWSFKQFNIARLVLHDLSSMYFLFLECLIEWELIRLCLYKTSWTCELSKINILVSVLCLILSLLNRTTLKTSYVASVYTVKPQLFILRGYKKPRIKRFPFEHRRSHLTCWDIYMDCIDWFV